MTLHRTPSAMENLPTPELLGRSIAEAKLEAIRVFVGRAEKRARANREGSRHVLV